MDAAELQFMFKRLGVEMSSTQVKALMVEIDEDKNDEISYEELIEWLMKNELWDPLGSFS
jgi:Ca2+-binding EF-hand superfamily protein